LRYSFQMRIPRNRTLRGGPLEPCGNGILIARSTIQSNLPIRMVFRKSVLISIIEIFS
jgi:hypothetical protein